MGNEVFFEVWDKDRLSKDDLMGKVTKEIIFSDTSLTSRIPGLDPAQPSAALCGRVWSLPLSSPCQEISHRTFVSELVIFLAEKSFESSPCQEISHHTFVRVFSLQRSLLDLTLPKK